VQASVVKRCFGDANAIVVSIASFVVGHFATAEYNPVDVTNAISLAHSELLTAILTLSNIEFGPTSKPAAPTLMPLDGKTGAVAGFVCVMNGFMTTLRSSPMSAALPQLNIPSTATPTMTDITNLATSDGPPEASNEEIDH
jgi:hypothetical protein